MTPVPRWIVIGLCGLFAAGLGLWFGMAPSGGGFDGFRRHGFNRPQTVGPGFPDRSLDERQHGVAAENEVSIEGVRRPAPLPQATAFSATVQRAGDVVDETALWAHYTPTREELEIRAFMVEQEANKELRNLLQVLDLDDDRQDRVFAALVRSSDHFHPALRPRGLAGGLVEGGVTSAFSADGLPDGSPLPLAPLGTHDGGDDDVPPASGAVPELVRVELDPEEWDVYERYTSEREAFWAGIVEDIEKELNAR